MELSLHQVKRCFLFFLSSFSRLAWVAVASSACLLVTEDSLVPSCLRLDTEIVLSSSDVEITVHTPPFSVWISHDPVFGTCFLINSPANDDDWVIEIHPGNTIVFEVSVSYLLFIGASNHLLCFLMVFCYASNLEIGLHLSFMIVWQDTLLVERENSWYV